VKLLVATRNEGKLREIRELLAPDGVLAVGLAELPSAPEVVEDGATFSENARKKAVALMTATGLPTLADDSGLTVEALGGRPGVHSARYAGEGATDAENNGKLLRELERLPSSSRRAAFVCAMVLALPQGGELSAEGRLEGRILESPLGSGGFGYDPLFFVEEEGRTLAEMEVSEKNRLSHRARALGALRLRMLAALRG
jgi:XTP/dITP diphosphohydrolase